MTRKKLYFILIKWASESTRLTHQPMVGRVEFEVFLTRL